MQTDRQTARQTDRHLYIFLETYGARECTDGTSFSPAVSSSSFASLHIPTLGWLSTTSVGQPVSQARNSVWGSSSLQAWQGDSLEVRGQGAIRVSQPQDSWQSCFFPESVWAQGSSNSGGLYLIFSSSHLLIFTPSLTPSHLHIFSSSHLLIFTSAHLHICSSSHLLIFTSSHLHICSSSHLHILTSSLSLSRTHIFTYSHLLSLSLLFPLSFLSLLSLSLFSLSPSLSFSL